MARAAARWNAEITAAMSAGVIAWGTGMSAKGTALGAIDGRHPRLASGMRKLDGRHRAVFGHETRDALEALGLVVVPQAQVLRPISGRGLPRP